MLYIGVAEYPSSGEIGGREILTFRYCAHFVCAIPLHDIYIRSLISPIVYPSMKKCILLGLLVWSTAARGETLLAVASPDTITTKAATPTAAQLRGRVTDSHGADRKSVV